MSTVERLPPETDITPGPPHLTLVNRRDSPILPPGLSDEDVVGRWLAAKATGRGRLAPTTLAQYRTEAERLFWYARQVHTPISAWGLDEFSAYVTFLQAPATWAIRKPGVRRGSPDWRPFLGPLTDRSAGQTQKIVTALFDWLRDVGYLQLNPATGLPMVGRRDPEKQARFLSPDDTEPWRVTCSPSIWLNAPGYARLKSSSAGWVTCASSRSGGTAPQVSGRASLPVAATRRARQGPLGTLRRNRPVAAGLPDQVWPAAGAGARRGAPAAVRAAHPLGCTQGDP